MCQLVQYNPLLSDYLRNCNSWVIDELVSLRPKVSLTVYTCKFLPDLYLLRFAYTWFSSNYRESWFVNMICKIEDNNTNENLTTSKPISLQTNLNTYCPQMFLHLCVILFTGGGGVPSQHASQVTWPGGSACGEVCVQGEAACIQGCWTDPHHRRYMGYYGIRSTSGR